MDLSNLKFMNTYHPEMLSRGSLGSVQGVTSVERRNQAIDTNRSDKIQGTGEEDEDALIASGTNTQDFAKLLADELNTIQDRGELTSALSGASALSVTGNLANLSDMLQTTKGREAIVEMAKQSLSGLISSENS